MPSTASSVVSSVSGDSVYLTVAVPAEAKIYVNGNRTSSTGAVREFVSRGLKPGKQYKFDIRAEIESAAGTTIVENKTVAVKAGDREQLNFAFSGQAAPIETAVTLNVPDGAKVVLAGNPTKATGNSRVYKTSSLRPGQVWDNYDIEVHHAGKVKKQTVRLIAGDQLQLSFNFDENVGKIASR